MDNTQRVTRAFWNVIKDSEIPAFRNAKESSLRAIPLKDHLDSLGMVNLIIGLEDALRQEFGRDVPILGRSDAFTTGVLENTGTFIDFVARIVE